MLSDSERSKLIEHITYFKKGPDILYMYDKNYFGIENVSDALLERILSNLEESQEFVPGTIEEQSETEQQDGFQYDDGQSQEVYA
ncbi:MAG: hypothetical protein FWE01_03340 [Firmicutes bacterium]|nr:hypothetical protein [Bacillota bacterium]